MSPERGNRNPDQAPSPEQRLSAIEAQMQATTEAFNEAVRAYTETMASMQEEIGNIRSEMNGQTVPANRTPNQTPATGDQDSSDPAEKKGMFKRAKIAAVGALAVGLAAAAVFAGGGDNKNKSADKAVNTSANVPVVTTTEAAPTTTTTETTFSAPTPPAPTTTTEKAGPAAPGTVKVPAPYAPTEAGKKLADEANKPKAPTPATEKPAQTERQQMLKRVEGKTTVALATKELRGGNKTLKLNIRAIEKMDAKKVNHTGNGMNRVDAVFKPGELGPVNGAEALAFGINSSKGNATATYNALKNRDVTAELPKDISVEEAREYIFDKMAAKGTKFAVSTPTGTFMNHRQVGEDVLTAGAVQLDGNDEVLTMTLANGKMIRYKLFNNNCINILTEIEQAPSAPGVPSTPGIEGPPSTPGENPPYITTTPGTPSIDQPKTKTPGKPGKPGKPTEPGKPGQPPKAPHKEDDGKIPGNPAVEADQDKGTPDVAGNAPATPGVTKVEPAPAPQRPSSETENRPDAVEGQGPETVDPNGSANVPGTSNEEGKGGSVEPN